MELSFSTAHIVEIVQPLATRGSNSELIRGIASLKEARAGDLGFLSNLKYKTDVATTAATVVLLPPDFEGEPKPGQLFLLVDKPSVALAKICARIEQRLWPKPVPGVHPSAVIASDAVIAASATIGPFCVIESGAQIGRAHV